MYFKKFPFTNYQFGNESFLTSFTNLGAYTEVVDTIKDNVNFYTTYYIQDGERPDILSQKLYNDPSLYWTFFIMNDKLREGGWPIDQREMKAKAEKDYPHITLTTKDDITNKLTIGQTIIGATSAATATVVARRLDYGQLIVQPTSTKQFLDTETVYTNIVGEFGSPEVESVTLNRVTEEYNSVHHYEDADGNYVDIDPMQTSPSEVGSETIIVTFKDRLEAANEELRDIKVIKATSIKAVNKAFNDSLRSL